MRICKCGGTDTNINVEVNIDNRDTAGATSKSNPTVKSAPTVKSTVSPKTDTKVTSKAKSKSKAKGKVVVEDDAPGNSGNGND
jgi:hypothetical protein